MVCVGFFGAFFWFFYDGVQGRRILIRLFQACPLGFLFALLTERQ